MSAQPVAAPYPAFDGTQACAGEQPELFFPEDFRTSYFDVERAVALCEGCPFRRPCLAYALAYDVHGIWGGTSRTERAELRKQYGIRAALVTTSDLDQVHQEIDQMDRGGASANEIARRLQITARSVTRHRARTRNQP